MPETLGAKLVPSFMPEGQGFPSCGPRHRRDCHSVAKRSKFITSSEVRAELQLAHDQFHKKPEIKFGEKTNRGVSILDSVSRN